MLYFYFGQEEFNIEIELNKLKSKIVDKSFLATNYKVYNNPSAPELVEILRTPPLMFGKILVVVNCEKYFLESAKGRSNFDEADLKALEEALQDVSDLLTVVFVCKIDRDSSKKIDSRRKIYKVFSKYCQTKEFAEFKAYQKEYCTYVQKMARQKDLILSPDVAAFLIERLGTNLRIVDSELEKLKLLIYPEKTVKKENIKNICSESEDIFLLADYILHGKRDLALNEYRKLCAEKHYLEILAVLQTSFSKLLAIKIESANSAPIEIAAKLKMPEFLVKKRITDMKNVSATRLIEIRKNLLTAEARIKTGEIGFYDLPVELAILS